MHQLDLSVGMLDVLNSKSAFKGLDNVDIRNYGAFDGIKEAKELYAILPCLNPCMLSFSITSIIHMQLRL